MHKCPNCGTEYEGNFCPECGAKWEEEKTCPKCGKTLAGGVKFCPECGYSFVPAASPKPTPKPVPMPAPARQLTEGTAKLYAFLSGLPTVLFGLLSVLFLLFFLAPVAVMPGGEILGQTIPSESYGNVYEISNFDGSSLTSSLTALIVFGACAAAITVAILIASLFSALRDKRITLFGKPCFLRNVLTGLGYVLFFVLFIIACTVLGQISGEDGGFGIIKAGAAPILILVFSLIGCLAALACAFAGRYLRKTYPALVKAQEDRLASAKPTAFETWLKGHKKAAAIISAVLCVAVIVSIVVPVAVANIHNGIYYAYNGATDEYYEKVYYKLTGGTWEDANGRKGKIVFDGEKVTLSYDASDGADKTGAFTTEIEGTIKKDILTVGGIVFAKKGHKHYFSNHVCVNCGQNSSALLEYTLNEEGTGYTVTGIGSCTDSEIIIPTTFNQMPVTSIGKSAFSSCSGLTEITIPDSVTSIGESAFYNCSGLTGVYITDLAAWCEIDFGSASANPLFYAQHLYLDGEEVKTLTIPATITKIKKYAFYNGSGLTEIVIPERVTSIGEEIFSGCSGLESIVVNANNSTYHSNGNCLIETKSKTLILGCKTSVIPNDRSVTSIGYSAFSGCTGLTEIIIPNSVTSIGESAFEGCSGLTEIIIPDSVTSIGDCAFEYCDGLQSVTIGSGVTSIGNYAFVEYRGLQSVVFKNPNGWSAFDFYDKRTSLSGLDNAATAAEYLRSTYRSYYWKRS